MNFAQQKKELRIKIKNELKKINFIQAKKICDDLSEIFEHLNIDTVLAYVPLKSEINVSAFINLALKKNKKVGIPICHGKEMIFSEITTNWENKLAIDKNKTKIPKEEIPISLKGNILILVPGLAFTFEGNRLGRGGGYYDRFLYSLKNKKNVFKLGLCYKEQILQKIPLDQNDQRVDKIIFW